jgi:Chaperone of endosialidase
VSEKDTEESVMAEQPKKRTFGNMEAHEDQPRTKPRYIEPLTASENHALGYERAFLVAHRSSVIAAIAILVLALGGPSSWGQRLESDGNQNTATGTFALKNNFMGGANSGSGNSAFGYSALLSNNGGNNNTAIGIDALDSNNTGSENTASGLGALEFNTFGSGNTASGGFALALNTTGNVNTAAGDRALVNNTTGSSNTAFGTSALSSNTSGIENTASGFQALMKNIGGSRNVAVGVNAGANLTNGQWNIYLGNTGAATESNTMRLGQIQTRTFIAGIFNKAVSGGSQVLINSSGQLGTVVSSARYKRDIQTMGENSQGLYQLRPVTFRYKQDVQGARQYGLLAEEVAKVYPELVVRGFKGEVESVQYHQLIPMLLNELQHQQRALIAQSAELAEVKTQNRRLEAALTQQTTVVAARVAQLEAGATRATAVAGR